MSTVPAGRRDSIIARATWFINPKPQNITRSWKDERRVDRSPFESSEIDVRTRQAVPIARIYVTALRFACHCEDYSRGLGVKELRDKTNSLGDVRPSDQSNDQSHADFSKKGIGRTI
jgi:hypothetical protein